jgi:high-affinity K+ transport system ATPase subunit B
VRGLFKDAIIVSPDRRSTNASTDGILCCQKEATFNLKDEKSRIVPYFSQLILQTSGKGLVSPITTVRHDPETGFEEMKTQEACHQPHFLERDFGPRRRAIRAIMITSDNPLTPATIAREAGVDDFLAQANPEHKLARIRSQQAGAGSSQ